LMWRGRKEALDRHFKEFKALITSVCLKSGYSLEKAKLIAEFLAELQRISLLTPVKVKRYQKMSQLKRRLRGKRKKCGF